MYKISSCFSGIGAAEQAFKNLNIPHKIIFACEIDKYAQKTFLSNFKPNNLIDDIKDIRELPELDFLIWGSPCFPANELVLTDNGFVKIKDINIGDKVLTHTNTYKIVKNKFNNGINNIFSIKAVGVLPIETTGEHPFYIRKMNYEYMGRHISRKKVFTPPYWQKLENLQVGVDYLGISINQDSKIPEYNGCLVTTSHSVQKNKNTLDLSSKNFWWFIGRYLADGWFVEYKRKNRLNSVSKKVMLCCGHNEINEILPYLQSIGLHFYTSKEKTTYKFTFCNQELHNYVLQFGRYCHGKKLSKDILDLPVDLLKSFLEGYISGDGHIKENGEIRVFSISKELILGIQHCIHKVYKIPTQIFYEKKHGKTVIDNRTVNQQNIYTIRFLPKSIRRRGFYENGYIWQPITDIQNLGKQLEVFNIEVEEDNSYTVNNCIVHNCQDFSNAGKKDLNSGRSSLAINAVNLIFKNPPKFIIFENVKSILDKKNIEFFNKEICFPLENEYNVQWMVLNPVNFGIPHYRERLFLIGQRKDLNWRKLEYLYQINRGATKFGDIEDNNADQSYYLSDICIERIKKIEARAQLKGYGYKNTLIDKNGIFKNLDASYAKGPDGKRSMIIDSLTNRPRMATILECKRLMGFPDDFILPVSRTQSYKQFGNSICVKILEEIIEGLI